MPKYSVSITIVLKKIHRWSGLLMAAFIIFYCITGILLNHRYKFNHFVSKKKEFHYMDTSDIINLMSIMEFYKKQIGRSDNPKVIRIKEGKTIEFLYGTHGKTTYIINPEKGIIERQEKISVEPFHFINNLHKAFKTNNFWIILTDIVAIVIIIITIAGLVILRYRIIDYLIVFSGILILIFGTIFSQ